jgi:uncharacterized damage-inducible protein DinB
MTTTAPAPSLKQTAFADVEHELALTRKVLERVPEEHFDWKPHPKSYTLGQLATHLAILPLWGSTTLQTDELDLAGAPPNAAEPTRDAVLAKFDENAAGFRSALRDADEAVFGRPWTLRVGEQVMFTLPKLAVLRTTVVSHIVHHRAQLGVYLRLLDVPVPSIYGPSADEQASF